MEFIIVTGLSGAGKTRAMNAFEDMDFYCIDNIPPDFIETFYDLCKKASEPNMEKVAIVTDVRSGKMRKLLSSLEELKSRDKKFKLLFLDAKDLVIRRRFSLNRRRHPYLKKYDGSLEKAIKSEREALRPLREISNYIIDTSSLSPAQLKTRISDMFLEDSSLALTVNCMSFGFKYGAPTEADLIFDVRCLPNPFYIDEMKNLTGIDDPVKKYVLECDQTRGFVKRLFSLIDYMLPLYLFEGKSQLVICIGCTGGKHRSVVLAQLLYEHLNENRQRATVQHRDIKKI